MTSPFSWRNKAISFSLDPIFNGRNSGIAARSQALKEKNEIILSGSITHEKKPKVKPAGRRFATT